jgi:predicted transcriptional regulator
MAPRYTHIPDARQRHALQLIRAGAVSNIFSYVGKHTIKRLIEKGWIEAVALGQKKYRVTQSGEAAVKAKIPD